MGEGFSYLVFLNFLFYMFINFLFSMCLCVFIFCFLSLVSECVIGGWGGVEFLIEFPLCKT